MTGILLILQVFGKSLVLVEIASSKSLFQQQILDFMWVSQLFCLFFL